MIRLITKVVRMAVVLALIQVSTSCQLLQPELKQPKVELGSIHLGKARGLSQTIDIELFVTNNNDQDLHLRSMHYEIGIDNLSIFSGEALNLPTLSAHQATSVHLEMSADLLQILQLIEHLRNTGTTNQINYQLKADLDFSAWLPTLHVDKKGIIPLKK